MKAALLIFCAALLLGGLAFMPQGQHAFWVPEEALLKIFLPAAALLAFWKAEGKRSAPESFQRARPLLLGLFSCWILSAAFSARKDLALSELLLWACYPLAGLLAWRFRAERGRILFFILLMGCLQAAYGVAQSAGLDVRDWNVSFGGRAGAFFGNPNFLGGHLALLLPLCLALALREGKRLLWLCCGLLAAGLVASQTRGAWLGAAAGIGVTLFACKRRLPGLLSSRRRGLMALGAAAALALILFFAAHGAQLRRLSSPFSGDAELSRRLVLMRCSLGLAAKNPLLGVGPGNFRIAFPSVQAQGLGKEELAARPYIFSEHSHNDLLQMAADSGLPAALLLLLLWAWALRGLWSSTRGEEPLLAAGVLGGMTALLVHGLANFPFLIAPTQATAWALVALGLAPGAEGAAPRSAPKALLALFAGLFLFSAFKEGRAMMEDAAWWVAQGEAGLERHDEALRWAGKALSLDKSEDRLWHLKARSELARKDTQAAVLSWKEAVRLNPHYHEARVELGKALLSLGDHAGAEAALTPTAAEAPNLREVWEPLAACMFLQGRFEQAVLAYDWAAFFNAASAGMLENKAAALGSLGRYPEAIQALNQAEQREPGRAMNSINRAITHSKMGLKAMALLDLKEALRRDPQNQQAKQLWKALQ
jgi:O-antigen ligase/Tfp pilus assembly protein PilF